MEIEVNEQRRYTRALERNLAELQRAILEKITYTGISKARDVSHRFLHIVHDALFNNFISVCIKIFDKDKKSVTFWYLYNNAHNFVDKETIESIRSFDIGLLKTIRSKLNKIRNKTHFHIDRDVVIDPKAIWKEADITWDALTGSIDIAWNILNELRNYFGLEERIVPKSYDVTLVERLSMVIDRFPSETNNEEIWRMEECAVAGTPKFGKNGIHLSAALLKSYGFNPGESFKFSAPEAGKIVLEKI